MKILSESQLPKSVTDAPEDNLVELYKTFLEMENTCLTERGIGLSAVQVGLPWRAFLVRTDKYSSTKNNPPTFRRLVNCEYEPTANSQKVLSVEGCLSIRDPQGDLRMFRVERFSEVRVRGKELISHPQLELKDVDEVIDQKSAIVYQHEIDHHRLKLISDPGFGVEIDFGPGLTLRQPKHDIKDANQNSA